MVWAQILIKRNPVPRYLNDWSQLDVKNLLVSFFFFFLSLEMYEQVSPETMEMS